MKTRHFSWILILGLITGACSTTEYLVNRTKVEKVEPGSPLSYTGVDYALPRTILEVEVVTEKTITKPGPFADYADRYLGVSNVPTRETTEYKILEVRLKTKGERDPDQVYRIHAEGLSVAGLLSLNQQGVINGINLPWNQRYDEEVTEVRGKRDVEFENPGYSDLTIRKNTEPMMDTIYRVVRTDTSFMRLPMLKSQISQKNLSNQAEEAANVIMKLRKRRFYMMTGVYSYRPEVSTPLPDGKAMEVIIKELAQMEYDYVSLFVGRTITDTESFTFEFTPDGSGLTEADDLFVFSKFRGILPPGNSNGDPVKVILTRTFDPSEMYSNQEFVGDKSKGQTNPGVAYRIPGKAQVLLTLNNDELYKSELLIAQYGRVQHLPTDLFLQENVGIEFDPELGIIKQIFKRR